MFYRCCCFKKKHEKRDCLLIIYNWRKGNLLNAKLIVFFPMTLKLVQTFRLKLKFSFPEMIINRFMS